MAPRSLRITAGIVSIESPEVAVDLWTPVYQQVQPTIEIIT